MSQKYTALFLNGFRATGKSTIGVKVAEKLGWKYIEMDQEIVKQAGKSIAEITKNGTFWQEFRQMEHTLLKELLKKQNSVVSMGGGTTVNTLFGKQNARLLKNASHARTILIIASEKAIAQRVRDMELQKTEITRPILDEKRAKEVQEILEQYKNDQKKQKEIIVDEIVKDSLEMYRIRKPLYAALTSHVIDTSTISIDEAVSEVIKLVT